MLFLLFAFCVLVCVRTFVLVLVLVRVLLLVLADGVGNYLDVSALLAPSILFSRRALGRCRVCHFQHGKFRRSSV